MRGEGGHRGLAIRLLVVFAVGLSPVLLAEVALRIAGYAPQEDFYFQELDGHRPIFVREGGRFVVATDRTRTFHAEPFPAGRAPGTLLAFSVGDSITWGHQGNDAPGPLVAYTEVLQSLIRERLGGSHQVVNCGARTFASGRVLAVLRDVLQYRPDFVLASFGTSEFLEAATRAAWRARVERTPGWIRSMRVAAFLADRFPGGVRQDTGLPASALRQRDDALVAPFVSPGQVPSPAERAAVLADAESNLRTMVALCREAGVPLVLLTVPSSLRWPPFATRYPEGAGLETAVAAAGALLAEGKAASAIAAMAPVAAAHPGVAAVHFRLGEAYDRVGDPASAKAAYEAARETDAFPLRALAAYNVVVRGLAAEPGVAVVDAERLVGSLVPDGITDDRLFLDHCHPTAGVHRRIAEAVMDVLVARGIVGGK
jgi:lysophospholipase L1-like esterase